MTTISEVVEMLGPEAAANGWNEARIVADLILGKTANQIALAWWRYRAASTAHLVSISESGSSRQLGDIYRAAQQMADYYQKAVEADAKGDPQLKLRGWTTTQINRV